MAAESIVCNAIQGAVAGSARILVRAPTSARASRPQRHGLPAGLKASSLRGLPSAADSLASLTVRQRLPVVAPARRSGGFVCKSSLDDESKEVQEPTIPSTEEVTPVSPATSAPNYDVASDDVNEDSFSSVAVTDEEYFLEDSAVIAFEATVTEAVTAEVPLPASEERSESRKKKQRRPLLACPVCLQPVTMSGSKRFNLLTAPQTSLTCSSCSRSYPTSNGYADLLITAGAKTYADPPLWAGSETFRNPLVSFVYERGWRQNFAAAGFPGPDKEASLIRDRLLPATSSGRLLDLCCGTGLFTRRFAASGEWSQVVAADLSEVMLQQAAKFIRRDFTLRRKLKDIAFVRADVARLPFATGSFDAVHAGAALHCWSSPSLAMAEIHRVLRPGGIFIATTFLNPQSPVADDIIKPLRKALIQSIVPYKYWEPEELEELMSLSGFTNYWCYRNRSFILLSAEKRTEDSA